MSKQPLSEADIIFPHLSNTPNFSSTLSSLRKSTLSVHNRLNSILSDSAFVTLISTAYDLPLVANERCGSWYIPPSLKRGSVYFKSTDGHMSQWQFSLRRLNLQLLDVVEKWGGAVIVDSTRRGKSMPDALSKTVPIWCCVINRVVFGTDGDSGKLKTPPSVVGKSEHAQIERRIEGFVKSFLVCITSSKVEGLHMTWADGRRHRISASQMLRVCATNSRNRFDQYGSHKGLLFQILFPILSTFILSFYVLHHGVYMVLRHRKMVMFKALLTITKPGPKDLHPLCFGNTRMNC